MLPAYHKGKRASTTVWQGTSRLKGASDPQLRLMSQTIVNAVKEGKTIQNALFTTAPNVSPNAQAEFNGVYLAGRETGVQTLKSVTSPTGFWTQVSQTASAAWSSIQAVGATLAVAISTAPVLPPVPFVLIPQDVFEDVLDVMPRQQQWD